MSEKLHWINEAKESVTRQKHAIDIAWRYAQIDGGHHKLWVIDQMIRALLGHEDVTGKRPSFEEVVKDEIATYEAFVKAYQMPDDDDPFTKEDPEYEYTWDTGIAP